MSRRRKIPRVAGELVAIPLADGERVGFGLVLEEPLMAFFDLSAKRDSMPSVEEIIRSPVAFKIWVMNQPIVDGLWPVLGKADVPPDLAVAPWFFKQDAISGKITVGRTGAEELQPMPGQLDALERAAVWSASHVVDRLQDHFAGKPNKWVISMRPKGQ
ncbi:MAG: immunity 26/phosphotriesterase HocA family protein [Polyangiaceae bacterium]|nr:immunity 26/phosphotriesterase HocA family protein [Polyangiaceae bacterium]